MPMTQGFELLKLIYETFSPSREEKRMRKVLRRECKERKVKVVKDATGNLLITKGKADSYPCICAHMDQVQHLHSKDFTVYQQDDCIFAFSAKSRSQQGLGADDKNGLWIALELLNELPVLKCAFFVGEEIGCIGSSKVDLNFFKDVRYCIQADRRNGGDLITAISGDICSKDFIVSLDYKDYGYKPCDGLTTDVGTLVHRGVGVSCINISCGYYDPHTDHETTLWSELVNAKAFAKHICEKLTDVYPHKYEMPYRPFVDPFGGFYGGFFGRTSFRPAKREKKQSKNVDITWRDSFDGVDRRTMRDLVRLHPTLVFEDILNYHINEFYCTDVDILNSMFEDAVSRL